MHLSLFSSFRLLSAFPCFIAPGPSNLLFIQQLVQEHIFAPLDAATFDSILLYLREYVAWVLTGRKNADHDILAEHARQNTQDKDSNDTLSPKQGA